MDRGTIAKQARLVQAQVDANARVEAARAERERGEKLAKAKEDMARARETKERLLAPLAEGAEYAKKAGAKEMADFYKLAHKLVEETNVTSAAYDLEEATWLGARHLEPYARGVYGRGAVAEMVKADVENIKCLSGIPRVAQDRAEDLVIPPAPPATLDSGQVTLAVETLRARLAHAKDAKERAEQAGEVAAQYGPESLEAKLLLSHALGEALIGDDRPLTHRTIRPGEMKGRARQRYLEKVRLQDNVHGETLRIAESLGTLSGVVSLLSAVVKKGRRTGDAINPKDRGLTLYGSQVVGQNGYPYYPWS